MLLRLCFSFFMINYKTMSLNKEDIMKFIMLQDEHIKFSLKKMN